MKIVSTGRGNLLSNFLFAVTEIEIYNIYAYLLAFKGGEDDGGPLVAKGIHKHLLLRLYVVGIKPSGGI